MDAEVSAGISEDAKGLEPRLDSYVTLHRRARPTQLALIEHNTGAHVTWAEFDRAVDAFAAKLLSLGLRRGDVVATTLPFTKEHVYLQYACFRVGVIIAPLDLRLRAAEILTAFGKIHPRAYFFLGNTPKVDFRPIIREVMAGAPDVEHWVQFQQEMDGVLPGAVHVKTFAADLKVRYLLSKLTGSVRRASRAVDKRDPALIIFTTGSTGAPKAALLCHENILLQNAAVARSFGVTSKDRMLVNLPPSHVGGQTEQLMTIIYGGGVTVLLHVFDAAESLAAVAAHKVTLLGQIPALFAMQWRLPNYADYDLSSLRFAIYGGQGVDRPFLERLVAMAHLPGTGLGLTETAGFCTYTPVGWGLEEIASGVGYAAPTCPMTVREPMREDGFAGPEKAPGETGELCFSGPQIFLGYLNDEEATRKTISRDGFLYTGDLGWVDDTGVHFAGRSKFVIKPRGYQVFPGEVETFIAHAFPEDVALVGVIGVPHAIWSEGIVAFVELRPGATLDRAALDARLKDIAAYKRPAHVVFVGEGELPLNRVAKLDYLSLRARAKEEVDALQQGGGWDAN
ncbi:MAG: long-chain fatty acid--CoA ligase [Deltaproteobacteria bacterium]|nr:MAG: long-chain fatty acid--CoA ligase [Deltaproteobacteria bacterium]